MRNGQLSLKRSVWDASHNPTIHSKFILVATANVIREHYYYNLRLQTMLTHYVPSTENFAEAAMSEESLRETSGSVASTSSQRSGLQPGPNSDRDRGRHPKRLVRDGSRTHLNTPRVHLKIRVLHEICERVQSFARGSCQPWRRSRRFG